MLFLLRLTPNFYVKRVNSVICISVHTNSCQTRSHVSNVMLFLLGNIKNYENIFFNKMTYIIAKSDESALVVIRHDRYSSVMIGNFRKSQRKCPNDLFRQNGHQLHYVWDHCTLLFKQSITFKDDIQVIHMIVSSHRLQINIGHGMVWICSRHAQLYECYVVSVVYTCCS